MKKSYYLKNGLYHDTTTGRNYIKEDQCEICGHKGILTVHHYLNQQKCLRDLNSKKVIYPSTWTEDFIKKNQKLFTLCLQCHSNVENMSEDRFKKEYNLDLKKFKYICK